MNRRREYGSLGGRGGIASYRGDPPDLETFPGDQSLILRSAANRQFVRLATAWRGSGGLRQKNRQLVVMV